MQQLEITMFNIEALETMSRALLFLDQSGLGTSPAACHLQMAIDSLSAQTNGADFGEMNILLAA
jgi:hypothetical protein